MPTLNLKFPLEQSEDNIVAQIKARLAYYQIAVPTVLPLGNTSDEEIIRAMKRGPCIFVVYENDYYTQETELVGDTWQKGWRVWRVLVVCTSMRAEPSAARRGNLGAYRVSDAVKHFLEGFDPVNNSRTDTDYPMLFVSRINAPSEDLADYMMLMRFAHPVEADPEEEMEE